MKKYLSCLLVLACLLSLCACGAKEEAETAATAAPAVEETPVETPVAEEPAAETAAEPEVEEVAETSAFDTAKALEGESVDELISAIGEPVSREDYTPSCMGDGEDGLWHYADFDVYTYRENDSESVYAVLEN